MSPKDDGVSETDTVITKYTVGPGLRMAIIFVSFIVTLCLGAYSGWFLCTNSVKGEDKANQVEVLKSDTQEGLRLVKEYFASEDDLRQKREGREYDKNCADKLISDIIK